MTRRLLTGPVVAVSLALLVAPCTRVKAAGTGSLMDAIRRNDVLTVRHSNRDEVTREIDETGTTPLMYAALCATSDIIRALIDRGAGVNAANEAGATALMWAATASTENVKALLALGAEVNARTTNGRTALLTATRYGNADTMRALLAAGADTADAQVRRTLLTGSFFSANPAVRDVLRQAGVVATSSADLTGTVLNWTRDDLATLTGLLALGVSPKEQSPLFTVRLPTVFLSARDGNLDAVRAFVGAGADPSVIGMRGWTALMLAASARRSNIAMLQYLIEHGADVNARDEAGRTALDWALTRGETEVSAFLRKAGARAGVPVPPPPPPVAAPRPVLEAMQSAVERLQPAGPAFNTPTGCVSCHNQSVPGIAITMAMARGVKVNHLMASHSVSATEEVMRKYRDAVIAGETVASVAFVPYALLERIEAGLPATPDVDVMVAGFAAGRRPTAAGSRSTRFGRRSTEVLS